MAYLMEVPIGDGSGEAVIVEVEPREIPDDLVLAGPERAKLAAKAGESLQAGLNQIKPALDAVVKWVREAQPDEFAVEFGLKLGGETSVIIAKGTAEVNFVVKLKWKQ